MSETLVTPAGFPAAQHPRVTADSKKRIFMSKLCLAGGNLCSTLVNFMPTNNAVERRLGCASSPPTVYLTPLSPQVQKKWSSASPITTTYIPYNRCLDEFLDASSVGKTTPPPLHDNSWWMKWPGTSPPVHLVLEYSTSGQGYFLRNMNKDAIEGQPSQHNNDSQTVPGSGNSPCSGWISARCWCKGGQHNRVGVDVVITSQLTDQAKASENKRLHKRRTALWKLIFW